MNKRASGVLMHVSSLPGAYGIGCFGKEAKEFIDFLSDTGCTYWQVLPFTPTDAYNSPYASTTSARFPPTGRSASRRSSSTALTKSGSKN